MRRKSLFFSLSILFSYSFMLSACPFRKNEMRPVGPEVKHDLVIFFKVGVSNQQVEEFFDEILARRNPTGTGFRLRAGIREYSREHPVDGHEAVSISFFPSATVEERETVMRDVKSSPIVYRVLENVAPADVKKLEDMKEPETSPPVVKPK